MDKKIYKISVISLYNKEHEDVALVCGTHDEVEQLCNDMSKYQKNTIKDFYSFFEAPIQVLDENGELFNVIPTYFSSGITIDEPKIEVIKDNKKALEEKVNIINNKSKDVYYEYEKANVLTPKQVWAQYESRMNNMGIDVSENSSFSDIVEKEK